MYDVICFSHLRWDFVFQRPQQLLSRCARERQVYFWEEPIQSAGAPTLRVQYTREGVASLVPELPADVADPNAAQRLLLHDWLALNGPKRYVCWYYTPMALSFSDGLAPLACVYDCMDELSAFKGAPVSLRERERELLQRADVVFCGGRSLYESKRHYHGNIHSFPSSVDAAHFRNARVSAQDPPDQAAIPHPRIGFFGVIDERMDLALIAGIARERPDFHIVLLGPVVKIDPAELPRAPNIHYLGAKSYAELPSYLAGWDVATLPFARNESTRYISPTKTPEYLAAGKPVVSTSIRDVVEPYGEAGLVEIADDPQSFIRACERVLAGDAPARIRQADAFISKLSWDRTWSAMNELVESCVLRHANRERGTVAASHEARSAAEAG